MRILLLTLFLASCGRVNDFVNVGVELKRKKSDPTFNEFVVTFQNYYNRTVTVPIVFNKLGDRIAGVCYVYSTGYREIQIDPSRWADYSHEQREQLIFHELGHCVFNRDHDDTMLNNYCPNSIMRSFLFNQWEINNCYTPEYNHYIEELGK